MGSFQEAGLGSDGIKSWELLLVLFSPNFPGDFFPLGAISRRCSALGWGERQLSLGKGGFSPHPTNSRCSAPFPKLSVQALGMQENNSSCSAKLENVVAGALRPFLGGWMGFLRFSECWECQLGSPVSLWDLCHCWRHREGTLGTPRRDSQCSGAFSLGISGRWDPRDPPPALIRGWISKPSELP